MGASAAAAVILLREKQIVAAFRRAGATSPSAATTPGAIGVHERLAFQKLQRRAVLREAGSGSFYLDEPSWEALRSTRRRLALLVGLLALAGGLAFLVRR
jgi:hypothetical protein